MDYYVLQVVTGKEEAVIKSLPCFDLICPLRTMIIRRKGRKLTETKTIFPGYLFLKIEYLNSKVIGDLKKTENVIKLLNNYNDPKPLRGYELEPIFQFLNSNFKRDISNIKFDNNDKIVVINGPLKELEGKIIKVDKRKQRATVVIEMYDKCHRVDFSYVDITKN